MFSFVLFLAYEYQALPVYRLENNTVSLWLTSLLNKSTRSTEKHTKD
jgi:hypothetical protein